MSSEESAGAAGVLCLPERALAVHPDIESDRIAVFCGEEPVAEGEADSAVLVSAWAGASTHATAAAAVAPIGSTGAGGGSD